MAEEEEAVEGLQSYEELQANLQEYTAQLQQVEVLLLDDPDNAELQEMYRAVEEVLALTRDLLKDAAAAARGGGGGGNGCAGASAATPPPSAAAATTADAPSTSGAATTTEQIVTPAALNQRGMQPASVAEQIRRAQQKAALLGQGPPINALGAPCYAAYAADGQYYPAVVDSVTEDGRFIVLFEGYGNKEEVGRAQTRPRFGGDGGGEGGGDGAGASVAAPKRRRVVDDAPAVPAEMPAWLEIKAEDDEKTKERKRKLIKSHKSKVRFQKMDVAQKGKQSDWQSFMQGRGSKAKAGFFTGRKKESMFAVPEGGKVGVIGSGRPMTEAKKLKRHEFGADGGAE